MQVDVAIVGAGGAGLSLLLAIDRACTRTGTTPPRIALVDPVVRAADDRTWCWWTSAATDLDDLLHGSWSTMRVVDGEGRARSYELDPGRYVMLRSGALYAAAEEAAARLGAIRVQAAAGTPYEPDGDRDGVVVVPAGEGEVRASWAFDSRPAAPTHPGGTFLLQHFRGRFLRFPEPVLDPQVATLMDFDLPQPPVGVAFAYCLPLAADRALVEYTEFSPERLPGPAYDAALDGYLQRRWPALAGRIEVEEVEEGAIPMTDAPFAIRAGARTFRIGTAGGATRGSTGYTFAAMQRQSEVIAAALLAGREPVPPNAYPARHRWMDAVLLRALKAGTVDGPRLFAGLFERNPPQRVVRFLDGLSSPVEELAVMRSTPTLPMALAAAGDALHRGRRRLR